MKFKSAENEGKEGLKLNCRLFCRNSLTFSSWPNCHQTLSSPPILFWGHLIQFVHVPRDWFFKYELSLSQNLQRRKASWAVFTSDFVLTNITSTYNANSVWGELIFLFLHFHFRPTFWRMGNRTVGSCRSVIVNMWQPELGRGSEVQILMRTGICLNWLGITNPRLSSPTKLTDPQFHLPYFGLSFNWTIKSWPSWMNQIK